MRVCDIDDSVKPGDWGFASGKIKMQNPKVWNPDGVGMGVFNVFLRHVLCCVPLLIGFCLVW
jgi:hypothetical protein